MQPGGIAKGLVKAVLPRSLRRKIQRALQPTVAEGWERYAKAFPRQSGRFLGDEWTDPAEMGVDAAPEEVVSYLDRRVFAPFLGTCEVLLEIGSGGGRFTEILLPKCERLIAAEAAPTMLKHLRERFADSPKLEYLVVEGSSLAPLADDAVDAVFSYGVFVHLHHWDIFNYLREVARVLKPGGPAIIEHANTLSELGWATFLQDVPRCAGRHKAAGAFTPMTPELMRGFCERAGLEVVDCLTDVVRRDAITLLRA